LFTLEKSSLSRILLTKDVNSDIETTNLNAYKDRMKRRRERRRSSSSRRRRRKKHKKDVRREK